MPIDEEYEYAGFWIRALALLLDTIFLFLIFLVIFLPALLSEYYDHIGVYDSNNFLIQILMSSDSSFSNLNLSIYIFVFILTILFWYFKNATPGKMILGMQIVDAKTGNELKPWQMIVRYIGYFLSYITFLLGYFYAGIDRKKQALHDKLARSVVIRKKHTVDKVKFESED